MKKRGYIIWKLVLIMLLLLAGLKPAGAEIQITDNLSVTGFLRYELGVHTGGNNPNNPLQDGNHDFTLSRTFLVTEWTYEPSDNFKLYAKPRIIWDQTHDIDRNLRSYDAFPSNVSKNDWTLMKADGDEYRAEVWELYGDIKLGNLWLRLGKQQIVWGEMISTRILDIINPLDMSWNLNFEPEEYENIRIPNWAIRGNYLIEQPFIEELSIEGFINPGDILPQQNPDPGSPFNLMNLPGFLRINEKHRRDNVEYGLRLGYKVKSVYGTLCYLHLYDDEFKLEQKGITPDSVLLDAEYQPMDVYGMTLNYDLTYPYNMVFTYEGAWIPNQPYQDRQSPSYSIRDLGTFNWALRIDRPTSVFPPRFLGTDFQYMKVMFQFSQTIREGDEDTVAGSGSSRIDKTDEMIVLKFNQPFSHNNWEPMIQFVYDLDDAYLIKSGVKYTHGDHWYFDLYSTTIGGSETRTGRLGSLDFTNQVFGRITYQF
jgi:hypothetical protein